MKKIISVLALASLGLGIASADVKFTCNYRTQMSALSRIMSYNTNSNATTKVKFDGETETTENLKDYAYTTYLLNNLTYGGDSDTFSMAASNDFGGVTVRIDPKGSDSSFTLNQYSGYINVGSFKVTAGYWKDGVMNGAYQLKNDADASNLGGETFAAYKLGSMFNNAVTKQVDDITSLAGKAKSTGYITYKGDLGPCLLTADLAAIGLGGKWYNAEQDVASGFAVRLDTKFESWDAQFVFKQASTATPERAIALHVQPLDWGSLKATFGGSLGFLKGDLTEYNADIRLRYVAGKLSITSLNNISAVTDTGWGQKTSAGAVSDYSKHVGVVASITNPKDSSQSLLANFGNTPSQRAMWNLLAFRFAASDKLALTLEIGDIVGFKAKNNFGDCGIEAFVAPGLQFYAGKNCSISTCARVGISNLMLNSDDHKDVGPEYGILIPAVIRVKL